MAKWTKAGVRHKEPRWYWVRCSDKRKPIRACRIYADHSDPGGVFTVVKGWEDGPAEYDLESTDMERTVDPIKEPT